MSMRWTLIAFIAACNIPMVCEKSSEVREPQIKSSTISASELPKQFDTIRTYWYTLSQVNPEELLAAMWKAGIPVSQAWLPLDNLCADPIGPRFTVELSSADDRIMTYQFTKGPDRLGCATMLQRYTISD